MLRSVSMVIAVLALAGCAGETPSLLNLRPTGEGPDEFRILPNKPLVVPESDEVAALPLPPPTPGGANLADPTPEADAVAALGGNPAAARRPADGGIVNYAARFGVAPRIRPTLAAEDLEHRRRRPGRLLERLFGVTTYYDAYDRQSLDQYSELERFRRAGIRTPAAPPDPEAGLTAVRPVEDGPSIFGPSVGPGADLFEDR